MESKSYPTSKIDVLLLMAFAKHFPPTLVILFLPILDKEIVIEGLILEKSWIFYLKNSDVISYHMMKYDLRIL